MYENEINIVEKLQKYYKMYSEFFEVALCF